MAARASRALKGTLHGHRWCTGCMHVCRVSFGGRGGIEAQRAESFLECNTMHSGRKGSMRAPKLCMGRVGKVCVLKHGSEEAMRRAQVQTMRARRRRRGCAGQCRLMAGGCNHQQSAAREGSNQRYEASAAGERLGHHAAACQRAIIPAEGSVKTRPLPLPWQTYKLGSPESR